ncbi:fused MFS/spermidine synthase [Gordonia sp. X0973]|uniref:spermidine synthase n=1 Tax=Gordonia sp. X0973 TaxID=2742602 RepID=UPI000F5464BE|nr:fused MFS/spermidine synthase [Gordonia sp. X0973]QKT07657.1 fused MFS/spermidine synthase [Gordonia sp. X0973]
MAARGSGPSPGVYPIDSGVAELSPSDGGWLVTINGAESSHVAPDEPGRLDFEYMRQMMMLLEHHRPPDTTAPGPRALHLGAAACALPRYIHHRYYGARQVAVEIDAALATYAREWFDLPRAPALRIRVGDARDVVEQLTPHTRDVVIRDAFRGDRAPAHLTTVEFTRAVARVLDDDGVYLVNCADDRRLGLARAEVATIGAVFGHLAVVADAAMLKGRRTGNVVIAASRRPIEATAGLVRELLSDPLPAQILDDGKARDFARGAPVNTDADLA